jgi:hypothetical protein
LHSTRGPAFAWSLPGLCRSRAKGGRRARSGMSQGAVGALWGLCRRDYKKRNFAAPYVK